MDAIKNFAKGVVSTGYDDNDVSIILSSGHGARFPDPATEGEYNLVWWNSTDYGDPGDDPDREIVRVTALSTDTLTIVRPDAGNSYNGEGSSNVAQDHNTGGKTYSVMLSPSYKVFKDLEAFSSYLPQGSVLNGKFVTSVASNNLTLALKTLAGNNPSLNDPVFIRIGNTVRKITGALSVTKNAGTNWFSAGNNELSTHEIDYFIYVGYNATDGVTIGFARIPYAIKYSDFSTTNTNSRYCAISTISNAASSDEYELVGRFNAILGVGGSHFWTIPATSIVINRPIYKTRILSWTPTFTGSGSLGFTPSSIYNADYQIDYTDEIIYPGFKGTISGSGNEVRFTAPMPSLSYDGNAKRHGIATRIGDTVVSGTLEMLDANTVVARRYDNGNWGTGANKEIYGTMRIPISL